MKKYEKKFIPSATKNATSMPLVPPIAPPTATKSNISTVIKNAVLKSSICFPLIVKFYENISPPSFIFFMRAKISRSARRIGADPSAPRSFR